MLAFTPDHKWAGRCSVIGPAVAAGAPPRIDRVGTRFAVFLYKVVGEESRIRGSQTVVVLVTPRAKATASFFLRQSAADTKVWEGSGRTAWR